MLGASLSPNFTQIYPTFPRISPNFPHPPNLPPFPLENQREDHLPEPQANLSLGWGDLTLVCWGEEMVPGHKEGFWGKIDYPLCTRLFVRGGDEGPTPLWRLT